MKILYIGNKLSKHGFNPSTVETLSLKLSKYYCIKTISDRKSKIFRLCEIIYNLIMHGYKYDFVLIDTYSTQSFYYVYVSTILCRVYNIKYIPILHGGNLEHRLNNNPIMSKNIFYHSHKNVSPSLFLKTIFEKFGYKTLYIPNYIDLANYEFLKRGAKLKPKILWVRAFDEIYNPEMAIYIFNEIKKIYFNAKLCMVGPDKDGSLIRCKNIARKLKIKEHIEFKGQMSKNSWIDLSRQYSIFINTTNYDNMPVSILEIMALGLPIVSTNVGGIPYLLKHNVDALLVEKNDVMGMVDCIKILLNDKKLSSALSLNGRKKVQQYSWKILSKEWQKILNVK
jgi:glycosyltransferase involved in cell wall biosynthesis